MAYWTLQNLGVGNLSLINLAKARLGVTRYQEIAVLDQVRAEVAEAYAKTHARFARIETTERAVQSATKGFREDLLRIENTVAPAIETIDSLRLLARARYRISRRDRGLRPRAVRALRGAGTAPGRCPGAARCRPRASPRRASR